MVEYGRENIQNIFKILCLNSDGVRTHVTTLYSGRDLNPCDHAISCRRLPMRLTDKQCQRIWHRPDNASRHFTIVSATLQRNAWQADEAHAWAIVRAHLAQTRQRAFPQALRNHFAIVSAAIQRNAWRFSTVLNCVRITQWVFLIVRNIFISNGHDIPRSKISLFLTDTTYQGMSHIRQNRDD